MNRFAGLLPLLLLAAVVGETVPAPLDPVRVAPHMFALEFENDRVRVLRQTIRNGETPPLHALPDRLLVYLQTCAWMEDDGAGGERARSYKYGEVVWAEAVTQGGETATVVQECKVLHVELL